MQDVPTHEVSPGARLARSVLDSRGRVLLKSGAELTERVLDRLRQWRIGTVCIEEESDIAKSEIAANASASVARDPLKPLFEAHGDNPQMQLIYRAFLIASGHSESEGTEHS